MSSTTREKQAGSGLTLLVASLTFGLFFGAGNLIFPASLGVQSGSATMRTTLGFLLTAVGLPIIGVIAAARSETRSLHELASRVSPGFAVFFTAALYLTIGPFFAVPRTATVSYEMGFSSLLPEGFGGWGLFLFSLVFFGLVTAAALRPGKLMDYVGKYLTPLFIVLLSAVLIAAFVAPMGAASESPIGDYASQPFAQGLLDGYNTMDALASLAFSIVILEAVRQRGVTDPKRMATAVTKGGLIAALLMAIIYSSLAYMGATATGLESRDVNGAVVLSTTANHYYGAIGMALAAAIMLVACLKTAIGLVTACSEMFAEMFPKALSQRAWVIVFSVISCALANVGLDMIIGAAVPVLRFLYPIAIMLIVLALLGPVVARKRLVYVVTITVTALASLLDIAQLAPDVPGLSSLVEVCKAVLPGYELGFGWVAPALLALAVSLVIAFASGTKKPAAA